MPSQARFDSAIPQLILHHALDESIGKSRKYTGAGSRNKVIDIPGINDPQQYVKEQLWKSAEENVAKIRFPSRLWSQSVVGSSTLTMDGFSD